LFELVGKTGAVEFWQTGAILAKVGVTRGVTVTFNTCGSAHCVGVGVNVYGNVPTFVLLIAAGDQVPVIPLGDVVAKTGATFPEQIGAI
jgi:hypothetical protein